MRTVKKEIEPTTARVSGATQGKLDDFEGDLSIDALALDMEWLEQPILFFKYSEALAKARKAKDKAKIAYLIARARVRKELADKGQKTTEAVIEEEVSTTPEMDDYIEACYVEDLLDAAVRAMHQRKAALENMVELLKMQYFSSPKEPRDLANLTDRTHTRSRIGDALNKKGGKE